MRRALYAAAFAGLACWMLALHGCASSSKPAVAGVRGALSAVGQAAAASSEAAARWSRD
ncbi:MAG: hypothetical protein RLZZ200_833, partial [Pseudomonadota bacterium]